MCILIPSPVQAIHSLPGRVRIHLPGVSRLQAIEMRLSGIDGVHSVRANDLTGNVLICFDPGKVSERSLLALVRVVWRESQATALYGPIAGTDEPCSPAAELPGPDARSYWRRLRNLGLLLGLGLVAVHRLVRLCEVFAGLRGWEASVAVLLRESTLLQVLLGAFLGERLADLVPQLVGLLTDLVTGNPLGFVADGVEALVRVTATPTAQAA
jgi:hypothetical protein